jgi:FO synthase
MTPTIAAEVSSDARRTGAGVWAIVPIKRLNAAKQRLTALLGETREEFAYLLACRTLDVVRGSGVFDGIIVVSPDPRIAAAALARGALVLDDRDASLNEACSQGLAAAAERSARIAVLMPADLGLLSAPSLADVVQRYSALRKNGTVVGLVRCKDGTGTNMVLLDPAQPFEPRFGADSFARHADAAAAAALELTAPEVAFDIDAAEDLQRFAGMLDAAAAADPFEKLVLGLGLRKRESDGVVTAGASAAAPASELSRLVRAEARDLTAQAARLRDEGFGALITYSRKVFLPLTQLCRDSCHYCTFAKAPRHLRSPYMSVDEAVAVASQGAQLGCKEALFTLGERPELRYRAARAWLDENGFASTLHYVAHVAAAVRDRTGLLPHINAGCMSPEEMALLRPVSASMGLMLESTAERLAEKGGPHFGSPDKLPAVRLETLAEAGRQKVPFTTGLLIGIGETREERIEALRAIEDVHRRYGHIQEVIIQNFVPKPGTIMAHAPAADREELLWSIAAARLVLGPHMSIQAPPNLSPAPLPELIGAGINDWGGVSPLTPDYVNPEMPWPEIERLRSESERGGKILAERLTIYPAYAKSPTEWLDAAMRRPVLEQSDGAALGREDRWRTGRSVDLPTGFAVSHRRTGPTAMAELLDELMQNGAEHVDRESLATLFNARGADFRRVCEAADALRAETNGAVATYVVNRNINYTNICSYRCTFCAFSKGTRKHEGAERAYLLDVAEIVRRTLEARERGATEVCLQGGIHPSFTGETYLDILRGVKSADPEMHVHAFSPLEVWHGATTLGMSLRDYLTVLRGEGLGSLPGTAAEILVDRVRAVLCPDKLSTDQWLEVIETAHEIGLPTTSTMMFGHVDSYADWAAHLGKLRDLQKRTHGFTEFVPLPFVAHEAPLYKRGQARPGPTLRESILMHAVARLALHPHFDNIQASWVKMGRAGMREALGAGANDLGGTLMNESITRAAGATHGQEMTSSDMRSLAASLGRSLLQRTTLYRRAADVEAEAADPLQAESL